MERNQEQDNREEVRARGNLVVSVEKLSIKLEVSTVIILSAAVVVAVLKLLLAP